MKKKNITSQRFQEANLGPLRVRLRCREFIKEVPGPADPGALGELSMTLSYFWSYCMLSIDISIKRYRKKGAIYIYMLEVLLFSDNSSKVSGKH